MTGPAIGTPQLPVEPVVPSTTRLVGTTLGRYTELGEMSYLEHVELGCVPYRLYIRSASLVRLAV